MKVSFACVHPQIVDLALLVRRDAQTASHDPVVRALPGACVNSDNLLSAHSLQQQAASSIKSPSKAGSPSAVSLSPVHRLSFFAFSVLGILFLALFHSVQIHSATFAFWAQTAGSHYLTSLTRLCRIGVVNERFA